MEKTTRWWVRLIHENGRWRTTATPFIAGKDLPDGVNFGDVECLGFSQWTIECRSKRHFPTALKKLRKAASKSLITANADLLLIPDDIMLENLKVLK